jgi:L-iditol 2-dehydrogenase
MGIRLLCAQAGNGGSRMPLPDLDDMVTHRFKGLDTARSAFEMAGRTSDDDGTLVLKVVIEA